MNIIKNLTNQEKKLFARIARLKIKRNKVYKELKTLDEQLATAQREYKNFTKNTKIIN